MEDRPEIERKYIVDDAACVEGSPRTRLSQAYVFTDPRCSVRVRIAHSTDTDSTGEATATLTVKGPRDGATRPEFECELPLALAEELIRATPYVIEKVRYPLFVNGRIWTVDVFMGPNEGLVLAEVELESEAEPFTRPDWCAEEVTDDPRYYNEYLARVPYTSWTD